MTLGRRPDRGPLLVSLPAVRFEGVMTRCVPQLDFDDGRPPRYLFLSGRPNRLNPAGVECLYFSEDEKTAALEYRAAWAGTKAQNQPKLTFHVRVSLRGVLDLENGAVRKALSLTEDDFLGSWRLASSETPLQRLGRAVALQRRIDAVRYPSAAAMAAGESGCNVAIFRSALRTPARVEVLGRAGEVLETLP